MPRPDVIVIGAGAAGLRATDELIAQGARVTVLEARNRIGGRVHTVQHPAFALPIELGAEFIHGRPQQTWNLLRETGEVACEIGGEQTRVSNGRLVNFEGWEALGKVFARLKGLRDDISFAQFLREKCRGNSIKEGRAFASLFVEGFDAADTEDISARSIAKEQEGVGDVENEPQFRLLGGYSALLTHLYDRARHALAKFHFGVAVKRIEWSPGHVHVFSDRKSWQVHRAVITLPVGVLQRSARSGGVEFRPEVPAIRHAAAQLGAGAVAKVVMAFRTAFWEELREDGGLGFIHGAAPFPTWWTQQPLSAPVLTGWAGYSTAQSLRSANPQKLAKAALASLSHLFKRSARSLQRELVAALSHNWLADPFSRGAYSYVRVGGEAARESLSRPVEKTLYFAGEAADTSGQASTVAGALASGQRAARAILRG